MQAAKEAMTQDGKLVPRISEDRRQSATHLPWMLWQNDPVFGEPIAQLVDESGSTSYPPAADTMGSFFGPEAAVVLATGRRETPTSTVLPRVSNRIQI